jgi:hypothetical protein
MRGKAKRPAEWKSGRALKEHTKAEKNMKSVSNPIADIDRKIAEAAERAAAMSKRPAASFPITYTKYLNGHAIPGYTATVPGNLIGLALAAAMRGQHVWLHGEAYPPAHTALDDDDRAWLKSDEGRAEMKDADRALDQHGHDLERALASIHDNSEYRDMCVQLGLADPGDDGRAALKKTLQKYRRDLKALRKEERERSPEFKAKAAKKALAALKAADSTAYNAVIAAKVL